MVAAGYNGATGLTQHLGFPQQPSLLQQPWAAAGLAAASGSGQPGAQGAGALGEPLFRVEEPGSLLRRMPPGLEASLATAAEWSSANAWDASAAPSWLILSACGRSSLLQVRCRSVCLALSHVSLSSDVCPILADSAQRPKAALLACLIHELALLMAPLECDDKPDAHVQGREPQAASAAGALSPLAQRAADAAVRVAAGLLSPGRWKAPQAVGVASMAALHNSASLPKNFAPYKATYKAMSPAKVSACLISSPCCSLTLLLML